MLFEMLAGRLPFIASTAGDLIAMHITCEPPDLGALAPSTSESMTALVRSMLVKAPQQRPRMREVEERLAAIEQQFLAGTGRSARAGRRRSTLLRASAALVFLLSTGAGSWYFARSRPHPPAPVVVPPALPVPPTAPTITPPKAVSWSVRTTPTGALIVRTRDHVLLGSTPWQSSPPKGDDSIEVSVELKGFVSQRLLLSQREDARWDLPLQPLPAETAATASERPERGRHSASGRAKDRAAVPAAPPVAAPPAAPAPAPAVTAPPPPSSPPPPAPKKSEPARDDDIDVPALH